MAKVTFSKLKPQKNTEIAEVKWNDQVIEVKQYLPIEDKINLVSSVLNDSIDDEGYYNPIRIYISTIMEMIIAYTNISFTQKQIDDVFKTFDLVASSGLSQAIFNEINPYEYSQIKDWISITINSVYEYKRSVLGILEQIQANYDETSFDVNKLTEQLADKENLSLLREIVDKLD